MVTILFDVTRLVIRANVETPTGIDRVTEAYGRWLSSRPDVELMPVCSWGGVIWPMSKRRGQELFDKVPSEPAPDTGEVWTRLTKAIADPGEHETLRAVQAPTLLSKAMRRYVPAAARTLRHWRPRPIPAGSIYLNVSHYGLEQGQLLDQIARAGVRSVVMVHDLIPIVHPEYCSPSAAAWHHRRIGAVIRCASLVIANSESTAKEFKAYAAESGRQSPSVCVAPLGLEPIFHGDVEPLQGRQYFVCVGTLEPRKNLTFLLKIWRRLADQVGDDTPLLVLVGQRGWENEAIIDHLERCPAVRRFVHEASGLNDYQLARLMAGATALLSLSFTEGFNLPVSEARALGVPVIASDIPVHRELGGGVRLLDPINGPGWLEAIMQAMSAREPRERAPAMTWPDHFAIVARALGLADAADVETV